MLGLARIMLNLELAFGQPRFPDPLYVAAHLPAVCAAAGVLRMPRPRREPLQVMRTVVEGLVFASALTLVLDVWWLEGVFGGSLNRTAVTALLSVLSSTWLLGIGLAILVREQEPWIMWRGPLPLRAPWHFCPQRLNRTIPFRLRSTPPTLKLRSLVDFSIRAQDRRDFHRFDYAAGWNVKRSETRLLEELWKESSQHFSRFGWRRITDGGLINMAPERISLLATLMRIASKKFSSYLQKSGHGSASLFRSAIESGRAILAQVKS